jgi:hypothetical protein
VEAGVGKARTDEDNRASEDGEDEDEDEDEEDEDEGSA